MDRCERYQAEMLEYLYDLPEEDEQRAFQEHLRHCPTCPARWRKAREQQQLLAAAARMTFPRVRFEVPMEAASGNPRILTLPTRPARPRWLPWAIAAGLLLALGGLSVPVLRSSKVLDTQLGQVNSGDKETATSKTENGSSAPSKQEPRRFAPASVREIAAWVELLSVQQQDRSIEFRTRSGEKRKLPLTQNTQILLRGSKGSLSDLRPGQLVRLTLDENGKGHWSNLKKVEDEATAKAAGNS